MTFKTIKIKRKNNYSTDLLYDNKNIIIITALYICGLVIGSGFTGKAKSELYNSYIKCFNIFFSWQNESSFVKCIITVFAILILYLFIIVIFSQCSYGIPILFLSNTLNGIICGIFAGTVIKKYGIIGYEYYILTILPSLIITEICFILLYNKGMILSENILKFTLKLTDKSVNNLKENIVFTIKIIFFLFFSSVLFAFCKIVFLNFFSF